MEQKQAPTIPLPVNRQRLNSRTNKQGGGMLSLVVFALLLGVIGLLLIYSDSQQEPEEQVNQVDNEVNEFLLFGDEDPQITPIFVEVSNEMVEKKGEYITMTLPDNWSFDEFYTSEIPGADNLPEGEYNGLTSLAIIDQNQQKVFALEGVQGPVSYTPCFEVYQFSDSDSDYVQKRFDEASNAGVESPEILTFTDYEYHEFTFLGQRIRRVGTMLYYDDDSTDSFNSACGSDNTVRDFSGQISFSVDNSVSSLYLPYIPEETTQIDIDVLDQVLNSIVKN